MKGSSTKRSKPELRDVTLVAVTSVALRPTIDALLASMKHADFAQVLLLSDQPIPENTDPAINWLRIAPLGSRADYSRFMLRELGNHIQTSHALCVQWDGFVLDGSAWDPRFLEYDYIGAVWPHFGDGHNVGNGGFSLRSRKLLEACKHLSFDGSVVEDIVISRLCRPTLEQQGIRFAPALVAQQFAYERTRPTEREFGFHGAFNLVCLLPPDEALRLFRSLEPRMLSRKEKLELFRWALSNGRIQLAALMLARLF